MRATKMAEVIRVLFLSANPGDDARLRSDQEYREINEKIRASDYRDRFVLIPSGATRPADLPEALIKYRPHIVHFSGHGSRGQGIVFEDDYGNSLAADAQALTRLFSAFRANIRLIFLNTCYSKPQAEMLQQMFDYTIGTSDTVLDLDAIKFARTFYSTLANGGSISQATEAATFVLTVRPSPTRTAELLTGQGVDVDQPFIEQFEGRVASVKGWQRQEKSERVLSSHSGQKRKPPIKRNAQPPPLDLDALKRLSEEHKGGKRD
jgi:hypothetical protein